VKFFLPLLAFLSLSLGGCGLVTSLVDGAKAEATTPDGKPLPPPPKGDSSIAYDIGAAIAGAGLIVTGVLTHGVITKNTVGGLIGVISQHVDALASSVPVDAHAQALQGLAQSTPLATPSPVAPPVPATS
jgi:hypothetical protein